MLGGCAGSALAPAMRDLALVQTREGAVRGERIGESVRFLGIPFAAPPIGALRFKAPQRPAERQGIFAADQFAPSPMQKPLSQRYYGPGPLPLSEDCLALNIWRPTAPGPHPVYVWIHGGGNVAGSSRMPVFDGSRMAREGIVCVTISYRVGALGFLDVSPILGTDYAGSGNNGMLDIVAALRWVRENIDGFGGDPGAVTVGGQSAGAKNVCTLLAMPGARGLFRAAIVQSGGAETINDAAASAMLTDGMARALGTDAVSRLAALPAAAILAAQNEVIGQWPRKYPFRPVVDGVHLPSAPIDVLRHGTGAPVPVMIGTTREENAFFGPSEAGDGTVAQSDLANMDIAAFAPVYARYPALFPEMSATDLRYRAITAEEYGIPTIHAADAHGARSPVWRYRLDLPRREAPHAGYAVHGSELPLVWDKLDDPLSAPLGPDGAEGQALSEIMHAHWAAFIRSGQPMTDWTRYDPAARDTMLFDAQSRMVNDPDASERQLWVGADFDFG